MCSSSAGSFWTRRAMHGEHHGFLQSKSRADMQETSNSRSHTLSSKNYNIYNPWAFSYFAPLWPQTSMNTKYGSLYINVNMERACLTIVWFLYSTHQENIIRRCNQNSGNSGRTVELYRTNSMQSTLFPLYNTVVPATLGTLVKIVWEIDEPK